MHIIVAMRGIKHAVDDVVKELSQIMLPMYMKIPALSGAVSGANIASPQGQMNMVQVAVRPIELYEIVFPKEYEDLMCATLFHGQVPKCNEGWLIKWFNLLRKLLHLQPINWDYRKTPFIPVPKKEFVEVIGIGMKSDSQIKDDKTDYEGL